MWIPRIIPKAQSIRLFSKKYTSDHEWILLDKSTNIGTIGITDYAQSQLGDIVHISLPKVHETFRQKDVLATIESVKVVSDIYAPVSGKVTAINSNAEKHPEAINQDAENEGWLFKVQVEKPGELEGLLDKAGYDKFLKENAH